MKKKTKICTLIVSALFGGITLSSCAFLENLTGNKQEQKEVSVTKIEVSNQKLVYYFGFFL